MENFLKDNYESPDLFKVKHVLRMRELDEIRPKKSPLKKLSSNSYSFAD
jgi:hypothetical protein